MSYDDFLQHFPHLYLCKIVEEKYPYHYIVIVRELYMKFLLIRKGEWTPGCSGGYRYWDNPQVDIYISTPTKILIDLKRSDDKNDQGLIAFIACEGNIIQIIYSLLQKEKIKETVTLRN